jgi:hypothetical protein
MVAKRLALLLLEREQERMCPTLSNRVCEEPEIYLGDPDNPPCASGFTRIRLNRLEIDILGV